MPDHPMRMSDADYELAQSQILSFAQLLVISPIDYDAFLDRIRIALSAGAIIDPTLYMRGFDRLEAMRDFVSDIRSAARAAKRLAAVVEKTAPQSADATPEPEVVAAAAPWNADECDDEEGVPV